MYVAKERKFKIYRILPYFAASFLMFYYRISLPSLLHYCDLNNLFDEVILGKMWTYGYICLEQPGLVYRMAAQQNRVYSYIS